MPGLIDENLEPGLLGPPWLLRLGPPWFRSWFIIGVFNRIIITANMHGYLEVVQFLVSSDADINKATHDGRTPACSDTMCCSNRRHTW